MPSATLTPKSARFSACIWIAGLASLLPLLVYHRHFSDLFWFGDEWDQLDQISRAGFGPWVIHAFAENFVPLFKVLWGGLALAGHGSYLVMLIALWLTHAITVVCFGTLLRDAGFGLVGVLLPIALFGLASCNIETLAWTIQWSAVLSCLFFLLAAIWFDRRCRPDAPVGALNLAVLALLSAASALSFSRGVLTGAVLAALCIIDRPAELRRTWRSRIATAFACLLPSVAVALTITLNSSGNHQHLLHDHQLPAAIRFGAACFALNPFLRLLGFDGLAPVALVLVPALKLTLIGYGLACSRGKVRRLLLLLFLFDLGNSLLLGIGRHHTGLEAAISSRYQYASLLATLPFLGFALEHLLGVIPNPWRTFRLAVSGVAILTLSLAVSWHWGREIRNFSGWRGRETRQTLVVNPHPPDYAVAGIPFMPTARAKQLIDEYHLH